MTGARRRQGLDRRHWSDRLAAVAVVAMTCAALVTLSPSALAQQSVTVRGVVLLPDGAPAPDTPVSLQLHDGTRVVHEEAALADDAGVVLFSGVPAAEGNLARLAAIFAGVSYYSDPVAFEGQSDLSLEVRVSPATSEGRPLHLDTLHIIVQAENPAELRVLQFVTVSNASDAAWAGGPPMSDGRPSGLTIPVPAGATEILPAPFPSAAEALPEELIEVGSNRVLDPRPVPPSGRQAALTYVLSTADGAIDVVLPLPYPTQSVSLLLGGEAAGGMVLDNTNLTQQPSEAIGEESYDLWGAQALEPGSEVRFRVGPPGEPFLPSYGWALAGLGLALLLAVAATFMSRPGSHDFQRRDAILDGIARLDVAYERGDLPASEYHRERGRELGRLILLEERLAAGAKTGGRGDG